MKIGFVWQCAYPWDVRLEKVMKVCLQNGHEVSLLCRGKSSMPKSETLNNIQIHRVHAPRPFGNWVIRAATFPLFFNPIWIAAATRFVHEQKPELLIVRDLPLALLIGAVGKAFRIPVILDMAENYPAALLAYQNALYKPLLFSNAWIPKEYEKTSLKLIDHTLVVTDEQTRRLEALGVQASRITVVGNTPEPSLFSSAAGRPLGQAAQRNGDGANLLFVGKLDRHRGVDLLIQALPGLSQEFPNLTLTLVGAGTERHRLENQAKSLAVGGNVQFPGWVDFRKIWTFIEDSTICLIPHVRTEHTDTTLPNKLFDYMSKGKAVVASDCAPMERVIRETGCGLTFRSGDVTDLQAVLRTLLANPEACIAKGQNGKKAVLEKYNWEVDKESLMRVIETVSFQQPGRLLIQE